MSWNVFDQAARYSIRIDPLGFLRWLVAGLDPGLWFRLEGWDMRESTVVAEWKAEGRAEGMAQGIVQGMAQARRGDLLLVLRQKFAAPLPSDLVSMIEAQTDAEVLSRWLMLAVSSESLDAFRSAVAE